MRKIINVITMLAVSCLPQIAPSFASPVGDRIIKNDIVKQHGDMRYNFMLRVKEETTITVLGNGSGDIDCQLFNSKGDVVVVDVNKIDVCVLHYTPQKRDTFTLSIVNSGDKDDAFEAYIY